MKAKPADDVKAKPEQLEREVEHIREDEIEPVLSELDRRRHEVATHVRETGGTVLRVAGVAFAVFMIVNGVRRVMRQRARRAPMDMQF